jgi:tungstate transport system permease protein
MNLAWIALLTLMVAAENVLPFGRAVSIAGGLVFVAWGAVMLVGGNIEGRTRVLTTAVVQETRQGNFDLALAFGFILLAISFFSNFLVVLLQGRLNR